MMPRQYLTYEYANARLKAMKTKLIVRNELIKLSSITSLDDLVSYLEKTDYRQELVSLSILHSGADLVDRALALNLARVYSKVVSLTPQESLEVVNAFTGRWDVHNLKTILLGKYLGHDHDSIQKLIVPAGSLEKRLLFKLSTQESVEEIVYCLGGTEYGDVLVESIREYDETKDIGLLTHELEKFYYMGLSSSVKRRGHEWDMIASLIRLEVDSKNITTLVRYVVAGSEPFDLEEALIDGGAVDLETLLKLKEQDIPHIVSGVRQHVDSMSKTTPSSTLRWYSRTSCVSWASRHSGFQQSQWGL